MQKIAANGTSLCSAAVANPRALAVDEFDGLYAVNGKGFSLEIVRFDSSCKRVDFGPGESDFEPAGISESTGLAFSSACGIDGNDIFVSNSNGNNSFINLYGPPPNADICPPPSVPPSIASQFATAADSGGATLKARINPRFWPDTRYFVQYGTGKCSEGGCTGQQPVSPTLLVPKNAPNADVTTSPVFLEGLKPATTYHYRFVAQSGGGGPVVGEEGSLRTLPLAGEPNTACPNQVFRTGLSALLPDCRAYELVSPLDKNNGDVAVASANFAQASSDGERMTFSSFRAFADPQAAPSVNQYLAERGAGGWTSRSISPPRTSIPRYEIGGSGEKQYKGFSEDLCSGWVLQDTDLALVPGAPPGVPNIYRRQLCGTDAFELPTATPPPGFGFSRISQYMSQFQGASADGSRTLLRINASLAVEPGGPTAPFTCSTLSEAGTIAYSWLRDGAPIAGAAARTYVPVEEDAGHGLQCRVSVADAEGASVATSAVFALAPLPGLPAPDPGLEVTPFNVRNVPNPLPGAPTVSGTPAVGETLTCTPGTWKNTPTFTYRWLANGTPIAGATASTYVPTAAERGTALQCELTGTNASGAALTYSEPVLVETQPPSPSAAPAISGTPAAGETLTCAPGTWSGTPGFAYQWLRNGAPIAAATASTRTLEAADEGKAIQCRVSAANAEATVNAVSPQALVSPVPTPTPPALSSQGEISGTPAVGETLTCAPGTWTASPTFTYGWQRNGADIPSATSAEYTLQAADLGKAIQCQVSAANAGGVAVAIDPPRQVEPTPPLATASARGIFQVYEAYDGGRLRLVSVLPNGSVAKTNSSVGTAQNGEGGVSIESVYGAVSTDGSRVFWTAGERADPYPLCSNGKCGGRGDQPGRLYLRLNATEPQSAIGSGQCTEAAKACTVLISNATNTRFIAADPTATRVLYTVGANDEKLFAAEIEEAGGKTVATPQLIANGVIGVMGASKDLSRVYFASSEVLSGGQANGNGDVAQAGKPNLYFHESGGGFTFVGTLGSLDATYHRAADHGAFPSPIAALPGKRSSRIAPDGLHAAFVSTASLTGYDSEDAISEEPDGQVFLYDATAGAAGRLVCVSCNPSGARPRGRKIAQPNIGGIQLWAAATLPGWPFDRHPGNLLSANGKRLFFNAFDSLVPGDSNGKQDVYEWEAPGEGDCAEASSSFSEANGGCLSLITSGQSASDSEVLDATPDGSDVFFTTQSSLLAQDYGLVDVYDARVNGGFPAPAGPPASCEGEACQGTPSPPNDPTPASAAFQGAGNVKESTSTPCRKGQRKVRKAGKSRCVTRHTKQKQGRKQKRRAGDDRRNAR